jgi:membrane protein
LLWAHSRSPGPSARSNGFIEHEDLTRGAAITYYTIFSIAPLLIIVIAIAGLAFGHDAAEGWVLTSAVLRLG